jgi:hypothetical protein
MHSVQYLADKGWEPFGCAQSGCQECVNELLQQHRKLVVAVVRRQWIGDRAAFADLVQEGNIALWRAIMGFDPGRGLARSAGSGQALQHVCVAGHRTGSVADSGPGRAAGGVVAVARVGRALCNSNSPL